MLELIKRRRSIRRFTEEPVQKDQITALLEAAMAAPSASNRRPWEFVVVTDAATRQSLSSLHRWSFMCGEAPVVFAVLGDDAASSHWVEDTSAATQNLLLAATELGLGAVWVAVHTEPAREDMVRRILDIPEERRVLCLVPVGHPAETRPPRTQYAATNVHHERYGRPWVAS